MSFVTNLNSSDFPLMEHHSNKTIGQQHNSQPSLVSTAHNPLGKSSLFTTGSHLSGSNNQLGGSGGHTAPGITTSATSIAGVHGPSLTGGIDLPASSQRMQSNLGHNNNLLQQLLDDMRQIEDTVDSIEIPARGRCKVYMAKYGYEPFKQSPNDNPDAELAFNAGDYIMVFDDIDEDGYFIGELMDGRRGYVPSNWLDRLIGEDLFEFQATTLYKQTKDDESESNSYPPEFYDAIVSETMNHSNFQHLLAPEDYHRMNDYVDLDDVNEVDDECLSDYERAEAEQMRRAVPPPQRLVLERQLNKSILIGWLHPQAAKGTIVSYQVYVDGVLKSTVPSGDRTKALLEGVDSNIPHRISVRAIDLSGRHSNDAGCTIVIGQKIPFAPSCVKASHITSDSALISWLPCNSNFHHVVAVNSVEVQTVRPGVYKHLINGLSANTLYRVWVRAKPGKILSIDEKNPKKLESLTTYVDFKTMPKSLPDPPVNVQVEAGPQRRTLLVTWLPLTLNDFGISNGCAVTGYAVFAGHKKLADIDSPTGDHALLNLADLESLHKKSVTVRTKSGENLSQDSMPCHIPDEYLKAASATNAKTDNNNNLLIGGHQQHQSIRHGASQLHHHQRLSDSSLGRHSPMRNSNRLISQLASEQKFQHQQNNHHQQQQSGHHHQLAHKPVSRYNSVRGRQLTRSLQNLESDVDSRRSSIPVIEVTGGGNSDAMNHTESYSEEEFENSMRFRGVRGKPGSRGGTRYRPRQSHSVDSSVAQLGGRYPGGMGTSYGKLTARGTTPIDHRDIRYFVALFDYDPLTMSPNPNAASEELAFKEGSIIKIVGDRGPDGFYRGELDNHVGFVPSNVVTEITDPSLIFNLQQQEKSRHLAQANSLATTNLLIAQQQRLANQQPQVQQAPLMDGQQQQQQQQQPANVKRMTALYDYDPQENSPNADTESEIPFKVGDTIYVYGKMDTDGFYMGEVERTKQRGLVPSNFLREDPLLPVNVKQQQPNNLVNQQAMYNMQQQPIGGAGGQIMGPLDPSLQQQQQRPANQFMGGGGTVQQPQVNPSMDPNNFVSQQQQQMNKMNNAQMQRGNIRGMAPQQQGNLPQRSMMDPMMQNSVQQSINRPSTLNLGMNANMNPSMSGTGGIQQQGTDPLGNSWVNSNNSRQQLLNNQQQQPFNQIQPQMNQTNQMVNSMGNQQFGNNLSMNQPQMNQMQQQPQMGNNQQQVSGGGGVLSNLLSSSKQMIGAATTPRGPNQPNQFPSMLNNTGGQQNQMGSVMGTNMMGQMGGNSMQLMDQAAANQQNNTNFVSHPNAVQLNQRNPNMMQSNPQQQQFNPAIDPSLQQQQQAIHNSYGGLIGNNQMHHSQQQQQQQQHPQQHNPIMGMHRGPMNQMGEEQGGNILNTMKNIFKL